MTQAESDDQELLAAEYVLGTLDAEERARARALVTMDPGFAAVVRAWERRLGELNVLVAAVEPPPEIWERIKAGIAATPPSEGFRTPADAPPLEEFPAPAVAPPLEPEPAGFEDRAPEVARLRRRNSWPCWKKTEPHPHSCSASISNAAP